MAVVTVTVMATVTAVCILVTVEDALHPVLLSGPRCGRQLCGLSLQAAPAAFARGADRLRVTGRTRPGLLLTIRARSVRRKRFAIPLRPRHSFCSFCKEMGETANRLSSRLPGPRG